MVESTVDYGTPSVRSRLFRPLWARVTGLVSRWDSPQAMQAAMARGMDRPVLPRGVTLRKVTAGGVPAEWLLPAGDPAGDVLLYLHGGAWTIGWYESHRWLVSYLARATGRRALAVDYRLAPEYPFPAALEDCLAAYRWLLANGTRPEQIVIGGDSAGGNLTLTTLLALRDNGEPLPVAGVCLSPVTNLVDESGREDYPQISQITPIGSVSSETEGAGAGKERVSGRDAGLPVAWAREQLRMYLGGADPHLPLVSPLYADLRGLPPLLIQAGAEEYLAEDARRFTARAREAGVDVTLQVWPGMWHVWQILVPFMPEATRAVQAIAAFARDVGVEERSAALDA